MDARGHVNNIVYFQYMEQARVEFFSSFPLQPAPDSSFVIVNASATFLVPLVYPGTLEVRLFVGAPGRSSLATGYEMYLQGSGRLCATGAATIVWIDVATGRSSAIPDAHRKQLQQR